MEQSKSLPDRFPNTYLWSALSEKSENGKHIYLYGTGDGADKIISVCENYGIKIEGVFASDDFYKKADGSRRFFRGMQIFCFDEVLRLCGESKPVVLVAFASTLCDVIENVKHIAEKSELYIPDVPVVGSNLFTLDFALNAQDKIEKARELFDDELSKKIYDSVILGKLTGDLNTLLDASDDGSFFRNMINHADIRSYADLGAYNGDTVAEFVNNNNVVNSNNNVTDIYALEPDRKTYEKLCKATASLECDADIHTFNVAAWNEKTTLVFVKKSNRGSTLFSGIGGKITPDGVKQISIEADTLDNILAGKKVDYIKYDVEGAEKEALDGSERTIRLSEPLITLSLYHRPEDIYELPLRLCELCPNHRFFLRRKLCLPAWEINLYAVPKRFMSDGKASGNFQL